MSREIPLVILNCATLIVTRYVNGRATHRAKVQDPGTSMEDVMEIFRDTPFWEFELKEEPPWRQP